MPAKPEEREMNRALHIYSSNDTDDEESLLPVTSVPIQKPKASQFALFAGVLSCLMYSICSVSMVLTNKVISTIVVDKSRLPQYTIILFQCMLATIFVESARGLGIVEYASFNLKTAKSWLPLNLLFIGMLCTGFLSLVYVSVPMVTIFKNLTNLVTVFGDWYLFNETVTYLTVAAVAIMTIGAVLAGANDLEFHAVGYMWMILNCCFTSCYTLYMRYASTSIKLSKFGMVYYNNVLSVMLLLPLVLFKGEYHTFFDPMFFSPKFWITNFLAGFFGFYLNFASLWCVATTSATTYAIVGSLNKVPITAMGFIFFDAKMTTEGIYFVVMATLGGFLYAYSKLPK